MSKIDEAALRAVVDGDLDALRERLEAGIDPDGRDDHRGYTLLHVAAQERFLDAGRLLLAHGAGVTVVDRYGNGPLWTAVYNDEDGAFVEMLLEAGADPLHSNRAGATPVSLARTIGGTRAERFAGFPS